jgi:hypothetical protein
MFHIEADPDEQKRPVAHAESAMENKAASLRGLLRDCSDSARSLPNQFERSQFEETVRRLKALGYLR